MRMIRIASIAVSMATLCATNALAQQVNIKPGLWQIDMTLPGQAGGNQMAAVAALMKSQMASMSPAQRAEIEKRLGGSGTEFTDNGLRTKQCITKEDIAKFDVFGKKGPDGCTRNTTPVAGGMNVSMQCTQPQVKIDAVVKTPSETAYTFESTAAMAGPGGAMMSQKTSGSGTWLGSDCGNVAPMSGNG
ncbi:DUF3617 domain-containing protein [Telluria beijingensis]|uniref:DUF3617 domain-containing protein n=1 Tax=Telluria beijingensis TaxID=3068633 RepID=UPI0027959937|nr:DUF3617 domain-containing protein [Massilia sp. REN29]